MNRLLDIYLQQFKISLAVQFQYRVGMIIWMIEIILQPVVYLVVWQSAAGEGEIAGYAARDFAAYYIMLLIVSHFTQMWHMWEYEWRIREGTLNKDLLRPLHPIHPDIASNITYKVFMLIVLIPTVIGLILIFDPIIQPPLWAALGFIPAVILAGALTFLLGWVVAMAAFWTVRIVAINQMYFLVMLFFSGSIAPLEVLPDFLQTISRLLPFQWAMAFPIELILGRLTQTEALIGFGAQIGWLIVTIAMLMFIWRHAVRRYSAVGG